MRRFLSSPRAGDPLVLSKRHQYRRSHSHHTRLQSGGQARSSQSCCRTPKIRAHIEDGRRASPGPSSSTGTRRSRRRGRVPPPDGLRPSSPDSPPTASPRRVGRPRRLSPAAPRRGGGKASLQQPFRDSGAARGTRSTGTRGVAALDRVTHGSTISRLRERHSGELVFTFGDRFLIVTLLFGSSLDRRHYRRLTKYLRNYLHKN